MTHPHEVPELAVLGSGSDLGTCPPPYACRLPACPGLLCGLGQVILPLWASVSP